MSTYEYDEGLVSLAFEDFDGIYGGTSVRKNKKGSPREIGRP